MPRAQMKILNIERQKHIVADTEKLLALARELQASALQEKDGNPAPEIAKKLEEIEKLAHKVKEKESE